MKGTFLVEALSRFEDFSLAILVYHLQLSGPDRDQDHGGMRVPADLAAGWERNEATA
jgi:hypothetical protein